VLHATGEDGASCRSFTKENGRGKRKRSLGCARDDETGETLLHVFFHSATEANLRPFGAPPSEGRRENAAFSHRHFRGSTASALPRYGVSRSLLSNTLRLTANEKDPSAALGMTKRGKRFFMFFSFRYGSQPLPPSGHLLPEEGGRMPPHRLPMKKAYDTRIPLHHIRHFERTREIFFVPFSHDPSLSLLGEAPRPSFRDTVFPVPCCQTLSVLPPTKKIPRLRSG
jgi:hypothetical protein